MMIKQSPDSKEYKAWLDLCLQIRSKTELTNAVANESAAQREQRINDLLEASKL
jgi:hypothetical protein